MSNAITLTALLLIDAIAAGDGPAPSLRILESREHYTIEAESLEDVVAQIRGRQARDDDDGTSIARTRAAMRVAYRLVPLEPGCRVENLDVSLEVTVRLPQWTPPAAARKSIREQWERMLVGVTIHEQGHRDNAVDAADRLDRSLRAYQPPAGADCDAVERAILRERIKAQMRYENIDAAYDRRTRHGITQAPKPPPKKD